MDISFWTYGKVAVGQRTKSNRCRHDGLNKSSANPTVGGLSAASTGKWHCRALKHHIVSRYCQLCGDLNWRLGPAYDSICYDYNAGFSDSIRIFPFQFMFEVIAFDAWGELEVDGRNEKPDGLASKLSRLHKVLTQNAIRALDRAAN